MDKRPQEATRENNEKNNNLKTAQDIEMQNQIEKQLTQAKIITIFILVKLKQQPLKADYVEKNL